MSMTKNDISYKIVLEIVLLILLGLSYLYSMLVAEIEFELALMSIMLASAITLFALRFRRLNLSKIKINYYALVIISFLILQRINSVEATANLFLVYGVRVQSTYLYAYWIIIYLLLLASYVLKKHQTEEIKQY